MNREIGIPPKFIVCRDDQNLSLSWRWFRWPLIILPAFTLGLILFQDDNPFSLWPVLVVAAYFLIVPATNSTTIRISPSLLQKSHGPLPFPFFRSRKIDVGTIAKVEVRYRSGYVKNTPGGTTKKASGYTYDVGIRLRDNSFIPFFSSTEKSVIDFLEEEIKKYITAS